ncbi:MAG: hypothetical protein HUK02_03435 [Bacteroidaceae bacterium]|nr:hypothetical protein [Bacteroidaceae bacterium]
MEYFFRIAHHLVSVTFRNDEDSHLLPSFKPFAVTEPDANEPVACRVTVDNDFQFETKTDEIGQFDCGGINHGVYLLPDGGYIIEVGDSDGRVSARMQTSRDFSKCVVSLYRDEEHLRHFGLNNCMMMAFAFAVAEMQTVLIHSSVIRKDGKGYLMTAPSGTGKSTHTRLWYDNLPGCDLMNDDNPIIRVVDGVPTVFGSPWSGKTPCYRNVEAPIGAIVRIQQRPQNEIRPLSVIESFAVLLPAMSTMKWDKRVYTGICDTISAIIGKVNVFELGCLPNAEAAHVCYNAVSQA